MLDKYERLKQAYQELTETLAATETMLKEATTAKERALQDLETLQKQPVKMTPRCDESIRTGPESPPAFADPRPFTKADAVTLPEPDGQQLSGNNASTAVIEAQERAAAAEAQVAGLKDEVKAFQLENAKLLQRKIQSDSGKPDLEFRGMFMEEEADQENCITKIMNLQERLAAKIEELEMRKVLKSHQLAMQSDAASAGSSKGASGIAQADKPMDMDVIQMPPLTIEEIEELKQRDWNMLLKLMQRSFDLPQIQAAKDDRATGCQTGKIIIYCLGLQRISFNHDFYNGLLKDLATLDEDSTNKRKHEENVGNQTKRAKFSESGGTWC
ncbi:hypothetical protein EWM64_g3239 [Hericium alpestre]|uniref:Uncharacterized protein n=1 Tax=Hericium alpestre TaxID=135208 RepID=A0A4Z0A375_9AGAM|nr:hypothetical protein EWM64_g3239 [Hericium alpestre]